jgi:hypothetical protein
VVREVKTSLVCASSANSGGKAIYLIPKKLEDDFINDLLHECYAIETELHQHILFRLLRNDTPMKKLKTLHFSTESPELPVLMIFCCDRIPLTLLVSMGYILRARNFLKSLARSSLTFGRRELMRL